MSATATTTRVGWNLIWARRGFRFFSVAMFVSLFGSGLNFTAVSWYILDQRLLQINADMRLLRTRQGQDAQTQAQRFAEFLKAQKKAAKKPSQAKQAASDKPKPEP